MPVEFVFGLFWRTIARSGLSSLPPLRFFIGVALARVSSSYRKDPEKVGETGPVAGPDNGSGSTEPGVIA